MAIQRVGKKHVIVEMEAACARDVIRSSAIFTVGAIIAFVVMCVVDYNGSMKVSVGASFGYAFGALSLAVLNFATVKKWLR